MSERRRGLALVLAMTVVTLGLGWVLKAPCLDPWVDGRQYNRLCYSDVAALYGDTFRDRGLTEDRIPYVDGENEYPVLTGLTMWVAALPSETYRSFFVWTAALMAVAALATSALLHRISGARALLFAAAPTLAIYGLMNWDLLAVALATAAPYAFLRGRDGWSAVLIGLGAAAKLYPALLVLPFAITRLRQRRRGAASIIAAGSAATWAVVNAPFAVVAFDRWSEFFRFNSIRPADWDSLWYIAGRQLGFVWDPAVVNGLALLAFVVAAFVLWLTVGRRLEAGRLWTLGFPLVVAFLLTSKVYSPQYGLWLLPWFALALPDVRLFMAFSAADVAVFVTRFQFFARLEGVGDGLPQWSFELAVVVRALILIVCVIVWARQKAERAEPGPATALAEAA